MSNLVKQINGVFKIKIDGREHPNLVVNTGLSNIFKQSGIASLCETLKVFNDDTEVLPSDTDYLSPVASSSNITDTVYGVSGDGLSDYFYMKRTWLFSRGQIPGVINKLAVYSDDGSLYAAALLRNKAGELDPVRPLFAPKVEITYESRWHFKQGDSFNLGTPVFFSDAGMVIVKTNMASKNDKVTYSNLNKPFAITAVELFSDVITTDDSAPAATLGVVDPIDYVIEHIDGDFGAYGQKLNITLPKDKYINDLPIATIVVTTTRGKWQIGFDAALEKPTLSKREIVINLPFIHGTVAQDGTVVPGGNPGALDSIFTSLLNATYDVSTRAMEYDGTGMVATTSPGYFGTVKDPAALVTLIVPAEGSVAIAAGDSADIETYLDGTVEGILVEIAAGQTIKGSVEDTAFDIDTITFAADDVLTIQVKDGTIQITNDTQGIQYSTDAAITFTGTSSNFIVGVKDVTTSSSLTIY